MKLNKLICRVGDLSEKLHAEGQTEETLIRLLLGAVWSGSVLFAQGLTSSPNILRGYGIEIHVMDIMVYLYENWNEWKEVFLNEKLIMDYKIKFTVA